MITIRTYISSEEANLDRALLGSEGIEAFVADEMLANADPALVWANGGVRLMVTDADLARADAILRESRALEPDENPGREVEVDEIEGGAQD